MHLQVAAIVLDMDVLATATTANCHYAFRGLLYIAL